MNAVSLARHYNFRKYNHTAHILKYKKKKIKYHRNEKFCKKGLIRFWKKVVKLVIEQTI